VKVPIDPLPVRSEAGVVSVQGQNRVPMFLVYKKGLKTDGNRPTLLSGYGGFLINLTPSFVRRRNFR